jgi:putative spermidine/putrescine transport system substrate-binding protein
VHLSHRLTLAGLAVLALAATGCSSSQPAPPVNWTLATAAPASATAGGLVAAARTEGTLNVIGLPGGRVNYAAIIAGFTRTYGIKVHSEFPGATSQQAINDVKTLNGTARAPDVLDLDMTLAAANANLFAPYKVATWDAIPPALKDPSGLWAAGYGGYMSVGYAPGLGKITSLTQLLSTKLRHTVALAGNPAASLGPGFNGVMLADPGLNAVMMASLAQGGSAASIAPGVAFFRKLRDAGSLSPVTATDATTRAGATKVVFNWDYLNQPAQTGVPGWKVFIPANAVVGGYYAQAINKNAPHPAAARLWEEFLYSQAKDGGQNLWLQAGARPVEQAAMTADGTIDTAAAARLPKATRPPVFLTTAQATSAAAYLAANWAREVPLSASTSSRSLEGPG